MLFFDPYVALEANARGRDFVVGDLHGQMDLLDRALSLVGFLGSAAVTRFRVRDDR